MKSNFSFLKKRWPELSELGKMSEENLYDDPNITMIKLRTFSEKIVDYMYAYDGLEDPEENTLYNRLTLLEREELIQDEIADIFHSLRIQGNKAVHESYASLSDAKSLLSLSYKVAVWFMQVYGDWDYEPVGFELPEQSKSNKEIDVDIKEKYDELFDDIQIQINKIKKEQKSIGNLDERKEKSDQSRKKLVFDLNEDDMLKIKDDEEVEIRSDFKFITTDQIDENKEHYIKAWDSVRKAFSGRKCLAYWRYPLFTNKGENDKEPDILIIDKELGVIVLEILDITQEDLVNAQYKRWDLNNGNSFSPIYDIEDKLYEIKGIYQGNRNTRGIKETAAVILPNQNSSEWKNLNFDNKKIIFNDQLSKMSLLKRLDVIEQVEGEDKIDDKAWEDLLMAFTGQITFSEKSNGSSETKNKEKIGFIGRIFGRDKKSNNKKRKDVKLTIKEDLFEVDMQQEVIGKTIPPGPQRIRGIAGSGKTVLLAQKATHMHLKHPDWKIALVFFTRSLYDNVLQEVNKWVKRFSNGKYNYDPDKNDNLQVLHAWGAKNQPGFYREMCKVNEVKFLRANRKKLVNGAPNEKLVHACKYLLEEADKIKKVYDAILIDEAQDLIVDNDDIKYENKQPFYWLAYQSLKNVNETEEKRLIWAYDEAQSLNSLNIPTAPQLFGDEPRFKRMVSGFHEGGIRKSEIMNKCYRTPGPVLTAAHAIGMGLLRPEGMLRGYTTKEDWENIGYSVKEGSFNPVGQKVVLHRPKEMTPNRVPDLWPGDIINFSTYNTRKEELQNLTEKIKYNIEEDGLDPSRDILVIVLGDAKESYRLKVRAARKLKEMGIDSYIPKALKNNIFYPKYPNVDPNKFWNKGGVTVSNTYRAKGNEAYMVYVIGLDKIAENEDDFAFRNQLFVALSRTKGWLEVSGVGDFPMYKEFKNVIESGNTFEFIFKRPLSVK